MNLRDFDILLPVKVESSRVHEKMIRGFSSSSLLDIGIKSLIEAGASRDRIFVYSVFNDSVIDSVESFSVKHIVEPDRIALTDGTQEMMEDVCCRNPFSSGNPFIIYKAINPLFDAFDCSVRKWNWLQDEVDFGYDGLVVVHKLKKYVLKKIDHNLGEVAGYVTVGWQPGSNHKTSQELEDVYQLAFDFIITTSEACRKANWYYFNIPYYFAVEDQFIDIDTIEDFVAAQAVYEYLNTRDSKD